MSMKSIRDLHCSGPVSGVGRTADCESPARARIHTAVDGYAFDMVQLIGESYGRETVQQAWREFTLGRSDQFLGDDPNTELFFSWLFHRWSPALEKGNKIDDDTLYGVPPTRAYLQRNASRLDPNRRRYLEACLATRFGFYEIRDCRPHIGFTALDVVAGEEIEVSESLASTSLQNGDIVFAHVVSSDGAARVEAVSPFSFPAVFKRQLIALCRRCELRERADLPLRRLYFSLFESLCHPGTPEIRNSDGDRVECQTLYFDIESAQKAFEALVPLALGTTRCELLRQAKFSSDGTLREAVIPWLRSVDARGADLSTVLMGHIRIRDRKLVVEVNSTRRAQAFRLLIAATPAAAARYRRMRRREHSSQSGGVHIPPPDESEPRITRH